MHKQLLYTTLLLSGLSAIFSLASCSKASEDDVPAYIEIDTASLVPLPDQGTASHKMVDVWLYASNNLVGAYEMPVRVPVLASGETKVMISAGIKMNGINETRVPYPFYARIEKTLNLEKTKISDLGHLRFSYATNTVFAWLENFESPNSTLDSTSRNNVKLQRLKINELTTIFPYESNDYAAQVIISNDSARFEYASHSNFNLPTDGSSVFLELTYKNNNPFTVGLFANGTYVEQLPILVVNPSNTWNKIYINLTPTVSAHQDASSFKVYFKAIKNTDEAEAKIYLDNIKLLHF